MKVKPDIIRDVCSDARWPVYFLLFRFLWNFSDLLEFTFLLQRKILKKKQLLLIVVNVVNHALRKFRHFW